MYYNNLYEYTLERYGLELRPHNRLNNSVLKFRASPVLQSSDNFKLKWLKTIINY